MAKFGGGTTSSRRSDHMAPLQQIVKSTEFAEVIIWMILGELKNNNELETINLSGSSESSLRVDVRRWKCLPLSSLHIQL
eukprot:609433-Amorphochlora_amoeboformis.AAC.3